MRRKSEEGEGGMEKSEEARKDEAGEGRMEKGGTRWEKVATKGEAE